MHSQDPHIKAHFLTWNLLNELKSNEIPRSQGTYILRLAGGKSFGRLSGVSDILYIGSTINKLDERVYQMIHPGPTQSTNKRITRLIQKYQIEISWCTLLPNSLTPRKFEKCLLGDYEQDHDELPPLNRVTGST